MQKILIVDDDPLIRLLLEEILTDFNAKGIQISTADNGLTALELIKREEPDIIFLDVMLPQMDGFEVCSIIKNDLSLKHLYIIMLTAKGQEIDKKKAHEYGADYYITKPFTIQDVIRKVSEVLGASSQ
ncbi:MAG: response regulator [Thermodesulfovibrionales bacterium]|jgi:DNA-binding response OmpR family regulator|nr:response regulator [Thermodesulfovibrionales bacterium]